MNLTRIALTAPLLGWGLLSGCSSGRAETRQTGTVVGKDSEVRTYIEDSLVPYLDSVAYQLCVVKLAAAPKAPGKEICPSTAIGYKPPPTDGAP